MMKNRILSAVVCLSVFSVSAVAQTQYETARLTGTELNGTARYVGMGGAMGALGADISTIGTNPAGIGLYRSNEISTSFSFNNFKADSPSHDNSTSRMSYDQLGFVYSYKVGNETDLRYVNFAFNYHKSKNFGKDFAMSGNLRNGLSQTQQMANMVGHLSVGEIDNIYNYGYVNGLPNPYDIYDYPYLGVMGIRTELVGVDSQNRPIGWLGVQNGYVSKERGGIESYDFNLAFNVKDRMYFGVTMGVNSVNYGRDSYYTEDIVDGDHSGYYELENYYRLSGVGVDLKLGAIFRPIEDSPLRLGVAVHTPMWYELTEKYTSLIRSEIDYDGGDEHFSAVENVEDYVKGVNLRDYRMITPWRFNLSAGTTFINNIALGVEYEYQDYGAAKMKYDDGSNIVGQNRNVKEDLQGVHTLRIGAEARLAPSLSVRVGYNYASATFRKGAYKALDYNDMRTDVEYGNDFARNTFTAGLGYRSNTFYADLAYKHDLYKTDFYAFSAEDLPACKVNNTRHQVLLSLGVRF